MGTATLRWVDGQGYVNCPHLYRVTVNGKGQQTETYLVQSFLGSKKAEQIAIDEHRARGRWHAARATVEELGPAPPGGSPTAIDDRAEW